MLEFLPGSDGVEVGSGISKGVEVGSGVPVGPGSSTVVTVLPQATSISPNVASSETTTIFRVI